MQTKRLFITFSMLALFIGCLDLLGLAAFMVQHRTHEIGIRKVLGASVSGLVLLLSKQFSKWVWIANIIAWPLAWYTMNIWLEKFVEESASSVSSAFYKNGMLELFKYVM